jgi:multidrug resistance efflux pump
MSGTTRVEAAEANLADARAKVARLTAQLDGAQALLAQCEQALTAAHEPELPTVYAHAGVASGAGATGPLA